MRNLVCLSLCLALGSTSSLAQSVNQDSGFFFKENKAANSESVLHYWSAERLKNAKELPLPQANPKNIHELKYPLLNPKLSESADGLPPEEEVESNLEQLYAPDNIDYIIPPASKTYSLFNKGTSGYDFSSSRLIPLSADLSYPYRAVGKLFFTIPNEGDFVCSASVIRQRIVVTAGHCVHQGSGGDEGFYTNWLFVPAFRDGAAPFQSWKWTYVAVTSTWATGGGSVPNAADYGMLEIEDRNYNGSMRRIGSVTGYLGYQTLALIPNHAHLLGYPCNLDGCQKMHQVTAQSAKKVEPNNAEYGSDMRGGSSGGPWVQNFGVLADGQTGGTNASINRVIGITSYGYTNTAVMSQGSSILDSRFTNLLNSICAHKAGNCSE